MDEDGDTGENARMNDWSSARGACSALPPSPAQALRVAIAFFHSRDADAEKLSQLAFTVDPALRPLLRAARDAGLKVFTGDPEDALEEWLEAQERSLLDAGLSWSGFLVLSRQPELTDDPTQWSTLTVPPAHAVDALLAHLRLHYVECP